MEVENKQEKTDEMTAACASAPAAAKKKKSVKEVLLFFLVSAGTGLIGIGTFTLLSKLNPFVQDAGIAFDLWLFFSEMLSVVLTCTFSFLLNKRYTFSFRSVKGGLLLYLLYYALTTPLGGIMIVALIKRGWQPILAKLLKMVINFVLDYLYCKLIIFKGKKIKEG